MVTLIQWRTKKRKNESIDVSSARQLAFLSHIELGLITIIVCLATAMARVWVLVFGSGHLCLCHRPLCHSLHRTEI
jgi:hypothetical protein